MKKHTENAKGFTLVELIIVITILAILGTIGFISFQGYTVDARNSKRTSDLASIQKAIEIKKAETSIRIVDFVSGTGRAVGIGVSLAGNPELYSGATSNEYKAGTVNFSILGLSAETFQDPVGAGTNYSFGATSLKDGQYQLASREEGDNPRALVVGNYRPRTTTESTSNGTKIDDKTFQINSTDLGKLKRGDFVTYSNDSTGGTGEIINISKDLSYVTLNNTLIGAVNSLKLRNDESFGLIGSIVSTSAGDIVKNGETTLPY